MTDEDKIIELGRHNPTVESVVTRLHANMHRIKHITAVVEWDDGSSDVCYDTKDVALLCFDGHVLHKAIQSYICDKDNE